MNVEQVLLVLYHLVILLANDKKWPPKQFQALKEKLTSLETQMNGANGWGPPKDRSPSGCPGSLTLKNLQESEMIRMLLRNASLTENYQFSADFILFHSEEAAKEELRRLEKHLTTSSKCWPAPSFPCLHQSLHYRSECLQWRTKNGVVPRAGWSSPTNIICKLRFKRGRPGTWRTTLPESGVNS